MKLKDLELTEADRTELKRLIKKESDWRIRDRAQTILYFGDGWKAPPIPAEVFGVNAKDREWVNRQCTVQSLATFQQPVRLTGAIERIKNVTYILATGWQGSPFPQFHAKAQAKDWNTREIDCGHDVMLDKPDEVVAELLGVAAN